MNDLNFEITIGRPKFKDYKALSDGMLLHHAKKGHPRRMDLLNIFLKDKYKKVYGGIIVTFLWNGMEINTLWVAEPLRRQGWGKKLLKTAEEEAKKRGCTIAYTNTFTWQAPEFYEKMGYKVYGKLENFPSGNSLTYFCKSL